jgi:uncharacterized damage-inducible protein DinB
LPLAFAQQRLWVLDQLAPGEPVYNGAAAMRLVGPLNIPALAQTFSEIVRRHEVLRTIFTTVEEQPVQIILQAQPLRLLEVDLRQVPAAAREQMVQHLVNHGSYHRGQVTTMLRQLGAKPSKSMDLLAFHRVSPRPLGGGQGSGV